ncbi:hypothetical protein EVAR_53871_1 [Eumeta japonica]|uniref:Uncharacterized protein n=1 Tax=Eumeta variegata TaxID=151549 RepID=A0A4C1XFY0_EUMVA|nr:hypothetical protein EVAR_53871_1 [Eumeta japonica]
MSESMLADAVIFAIKSSSKETSRVMCEPSEILENLLTFNGNVSKWIAFRAVYNDTSGLFSDVQNVARIRKALSREAFIYTETDSLRIMQALKRRFGRPDATIKQELHELRRMAPMNNGMSDVNSFANTDYQNTDEPELIMLSNLSNKINYQCCASMLAQESGRYNPKSAPERRPRRTNAINIVYHQNPLLVEAVSYEPPPLNHSCRRPRSVLLDPPDDLTVEVEKLIELNKMAIE